MAKKKILLVVDVENWAFDHIANSLVAFLRNIDFTIIYSDQLKTTKYDGYDIIHFFHWSLYHHWKRFGFEPVKGQHLTLGIHGHHNSTEELSYLGVMSAISVTSKELQKKIGNSGSPTTVFYCPDGVYNAFFTNKVPILLKDKIQLGWTGNSAWGWDGKDTKGIHIVESAMVGLEDKYELKIADKKLKWRTQEEMVAWYNSIDIIICASAHEGTPLPILEAASCGRAVITTKVGIVPEFNNNRNCIIFERSVQKLQELLRGLERNKIKSVAHNASITAKNWDRKLLCKNYENMWKGIERRYISITAFSLENSFGGVEISAGCLTEGLKKLGYDAVHRIKTDPIDIHENDVVLVHCWNEVRLIDQLLKKTQNVFLCIHHLCLNQRNWILPSNKDYTWLESAIKQQAVVISKVPRVFVFNPYQCDIGKLWFENASFEWLQNGVVPDVTTVRKVKDSVLFCGRVEAHKGFRVFKRAVDPLIRSGHIQWCKVAGKICDTYKVPKGIDMLGKIPRGEVLKLYAQSELFITPSRYESFPYAILEAGLHRCCVVTTDIPGFREIFGDTVVYIPQNDPEALSEKIGILLADKEKMNQYAEALHDLVVTKYTDVEMARMFIRKLKV